MRISRQIGWSNKSNILYEMLGELYLLRCQLASCGTTSSTTTVPLIERSFTYTTQSSDNEAFDLYWDGFAGAINSVTVNWGDGNQAVYSVSLTDNETFSHTYSTPGTRTITVSWLISSLINPPYIFELNTLFPDKPRTAFNSGNVDFHRLGFETNASTFTPTMSSCTSLRRVYIKQSYFFGTPSTTIPTLNLSMTNSLEEVKVSDSTISNLILSPSGQLNRVDLYGVAPSGTIMNALVIAADNYNQNNGIYDSFLSGSFSPAGIIAKNNLIAKGWSVTP